MDWAQKEWENSFVEDVYVNIGSPHYFINKYGTDWPYCNRLSSVGDISDELIEKATKVSYWGKDEADALNHRSVLRMIFPKTPLFLFFPANNHIGCKYYAPKSS